MIGAKVLPSYTAVTLGPWWLLSPEAEGQYKKNKCSNNPYLPVISLRLSTTASVWETVWHLKQNCTSSSFVVTVWPCIKPRSFTLVWTCWAWWCLSWYQVWKKSIYKHLNACQSQRSPKQLSLLWILIVKKNLSWAWPYQQVVAVQLISSKLIEKFARKWARKLLLSHTSKVVITTTAYHCHNLASIKRYKNINRHAKYLAYVFEIDKNISNLIHIYTC